MEDLSMCKFCELDELDNIAKIESEEINVVVGKRVMSEHLLSLDIERDDNGYYLSTVYFMDDGDPVAKVKVAIKYCPFCGRELKIGE
jgi:hypothetical protein